jgi:hypothetical protein
MNQVQRSVYENDLQVITKRGLDTELRSKDKLRKWKRVVQVSSSFTET